MGWSHIQDLPYFMILTQATWEFEVHLIYSFMSLPPPRCYKSLLSLPVVPSPVPGN